MPYQTHIFISNVLIKAFGFQYLQPNRQPEVLIENLGIQRSIWEHAQNVYKITYRVYHAGGLFSLIKIQ